MVLFDGQPTLLTNGKEVIPVRLTAPSQITTQVQPLASGTLTVRVAKSAETLAVMFWDWIAEDRLIGAGGGTEGVNRVE